MTLPGELTCMGPIHSALVQTETLLQVDIPCQVSVQPDVITLGNLDHSDGPPPLHLQTLGLGSIQTSVCDLEALNGHIAKLVSSADKTYRDWQKHLRVGPKACTEAKQSISKVLKQICIDSHNLGLRCFELDGERGDCGFDKTFQPWRQLSRLRICMQTLLHIQQATLSYRSSSGSETTSPSWLDLVYTDLVAHRTWIAAARNAEALEDLVKLLCAEFSDSNHCKTLHVEAKQFNTLVRISSQQYNHEVLKHFRFPDQEALLRRVIEGCDITTNDTLVKSPAFHRWISTTNSLLWVTDSSWMDLAIIAASAIEYLGQRANANVAVCYFFCEEIREPGEVLRRLFKTIIGQLAQQSIRAYEILEASQYKPFQWTFEGLCCIMGQILNCFDEVSIVLAGRDVLRIILPQINSTFLSTTSNEAAGQQLGSRSTTIRFLFLGGVCDDMQQATHNFGAESEDEASNEASGLDGHIDALLPEDTKADTLSWISEVLHVRLAPLAQVVPSAVATFEPLKTISGSVAEDIETRTIGDFTTASRTVDRVLSHFLRASGDSSDRSCLVLHQYHGLSSVNLFHYTLVDFIADSLQEPLLRLSAYPTSVSSLSMAIFCVQYICLPQFSTEAERDHRREKQRIAHRDQSYPFFRYAATAWLQLAKDHWDDHELQVVAGQLFDHDYILNFEQWLVECARVWFPFDIGFRALSHKPLTELTSAVAGRGSLKLQVAALMGLNHICKKLLDEGADINESSALGTALHCALLGPAALVGPWVHIIHEYTRLDKNETLRSFRRANIELLLDHGADCNQGSSSKGDTILPGTLALLACSRFMDATLFFRILGDQPSFEPHFRSCFDRRVFLDVMNLSHPTKREAQLFLNQLCEGLSQRTLSNLGSDNAAAVYDSMWRFTETIDLDWFDKIKEEYVPNVPDETFDSFVEMEAIESLNIMRHVCKDPRFNVNKISEDGISLLFKARLQGLEMVKLVVQAGADLSVRNEQGMTIAHLCAQSGNSQMLRYVVEQGADTALVTNKSDDPGLEWLALRNVWHFAASRSLKTLAALIDLGIKDDQELFTVSQAGNTPLVDMILDLDALVEHSKESLDTFDSAIELLRKISIKDSKLFKSKVPILHTAVNLGSQALIEILLQMGAEISLDDDGASPLHFCRVDGDQSYLCYVRDLCRDLPLQDNDGKTPIESIIATRFREPEDELPAYVIEELCCSATKESKDSQGRDLWERVCVDLLPRLSRSMGSQSNIIVPFMDHLIDQGVLGAHEANSKTSGAIVLLEGLSEADTVPVLLASIICRILETTKYEKCLLGGPNVVTCMKWASRINNIKLVKLMLQHGAPVHEEAFEISVLQSACLDSTCNMAMFCLLLDHADTAKINDLGQKGIGLVHLLLHKEVKQREIKLRALLDKGADPNLCSASGVPSLIMYMMENQQECVNILLKYGADVNEKNSDGMDIALTAASRGSLTVLKKLLDHETLKVDWNATCFTKFSVRRPEGPIATVEFLKANALHLAALNGNTAILEFYITNKLLTDLEIATSPDQYRPIHFACLGGWVTCIRFLAKNGADINTRTTDGSSALHLAVRAHHLGAVETLIELGVSVDCQDNVRTTPLIYAVKQGSKDIVDVLLGANPSDSNKRQERDDFPRKKVRYLSSALDTAIRRSDMRLCRLLWNAGCSFELPLPSCHGCTPLMAALGQGRTEIALWMLEVMDLESKSSALDRQCDKHFSVGTTSLQIACGLKDCERLVKKLLEVYLDAGKNWLQWPIGVLHVCATRNNAKALALVLAYVKDNEDILRANYPTLPAKLDKWLLNKPISASELGEPYYYGLTPLHVAIIKNSDEAARLLLESGADPDQEDFYRSVPLHLAVKEERLEIIKELIRHGCQVDRQDGSGYTALMRAVDDGSLEVVKILVDAGANTSVCDSDRMSLLNIAGDSSQTPSVFQYLLQLGLDPYQADNFGYFPFHDAILDTHFTTYIVNSGLDFYRACAHDVFKGLLSMALESRGTLRRLIRRIPSDFLPGALINVWPQRYVSPLCNAARRGNTEAMDILIRHGAILEFEGCDEGTALMSACRAGHLQAVAYLVRAGAQVSYVKDGKIRSALLAGKTFDVVVNWLLVVRWTEQKRLANFDEELNNPEIKLWAGTVVIEMELNGVGNQYGHAWKETMLEYLQRLTDLRLDLRGKVVQPARWH